MGTLLDRYPTFGFVHHHPMNKGSNAYIDCLLPDCGNSSAPTQGILCNQWSTVCYEHW